MKHNRAPLLSASFLTLLAASQVFANDDIEVVTVSATPVSVSDTGSSISIIGREEIERRSAATIQDLLREIPGFAVSQQGSLGAVAQIRVRGAEANQVLVLINGIEANDLAQGSEFDFSQISTRDIERIEVVRGPQSALWGSDAMAGVINIITLPNAAESGVDVGLEAGSFSTTRAGISATHVSEANTLRATVDYLDTDGTNISRTGNEDDGLRNLTLGIAGNWQAAENFQVEYSYRHSDKTTDFDGTDFVTTGLPTDADNRTDSEYHYAGVSLKHDISDQLHHQLSLHRTDSENATDTGAQVLAVSEGEKSALRYQFNLTSNNHHVSLIGESETEKFKQRGQASPFGDPNQDREIDTVSVAAEYRFSGDSFNFSASVRQDNNDDFEDASSWRVTGNYQFVNTTLYASTGLSIKNPTFTERFGFFTNFTGNPDLEPEESTSYELGVRHSFNDELRVNVALFRAELENEINGFVFDPVTFGFTSANVAGESNRDGVEFSFDYRVSDAVSLKGGYTYLDATQPDGTGNDVTEVRRPENTGYLVASLTQQDWGADFAWHHTGTQEDDYFPPFPPFQERVELSSFNLLSATGYYDLNDKTRLTLRLENVTDEEYEQVYGYVSPGFSAHAGIRIRW